MAPEKKRDIATIISIATTLAVLVVATLQYIASTKWNNIENYTRVTVLETKVCTIEKNIEDIRFGIEEINKNQTELLMMMNNNRGGGTQNRGTFNGYRGIE